MGELGLAGAGEAGKESRALAEPLLASLTDCQPNTKIPSIRIKIYTVENQSMHSLGAWQGSPPDGGGRGG